jgi:hypothetical protein
MNALRRNSPEVLFGVLLFCLMPAVVFAQGSFTGKWQLKEPSALTQRQTNVSKALGPGARRIEPSIVLELRADGEKLSGTVHETGLGRPSETMEIIEGTIAGKTFSFKTVPLPRIDSRSTVTWKGEMQADDTIAVTRDVVTTYMAVARGGGGFRGGVPVDPRTGSTLPPPPSEKSRDAKAGTLIFARVN